MRDAGFAQAFARRTDASMDAHETAVASFNFSDW
jgi:hypothetical protein